MGAARPRLLASIDRRGAGFYRAFASTRMTVLLALGAARTGMRQVRGVLTVDDVSVTDPVVLLRGDELPAAEACSAAALMSPDDRRPVQTFAVTYLKDASWRRICVCRALSPGPGSNPSCSAS